VIQFRLRVLRRLRNSWVLRSLSTRLRRNALAYRVNAILKARRLESRRARLLQHYASEPASHGNLDAIGMMRARLAARDIQVRARARGELNLFWVGASASQDHAGLAQGLEQFGTLEMFHSTNGTYGPRFPQGSMFDREVQLENDAALVAQVAAAHQRRPLDAVLGQMWRYVYSPDALKRIQQLGVPVLNISMDDRLPELWLPHGGLQLGAIGLGSATDLVLTTSPETCNWYAVEGVPALFFPLGSDPRLFRPSGEYRYDVLFVGSRYGLRERLVQTLRKSGVPITAYGPGWPDGALNAAEVAAAFSSTRIVLGVGTVGHSSRTYTLKLRDFDATMAGALYVTHRNPDLLRLFREDGEIVCYTSAAECALKLRYYLEHEEERRAIAEGGLARARKDYTWEARFTEVFTQIGLLAPE
jgi:spore maturation protein CgeB